MRRREKPTTGKPPTPPPTRPQPNARPAPARPVDWSARAPRLVAAGLVLAVFAVYAQTTGYDFVNLDDRDYITANPHVTTGLTAGNVVWAFTHAHAANWHPLTWVSHQLDWSVFGGWAGGHHLVGLLLHAAAAVALFCALRRLTGDLWPSALAAALFALHPQRVESVAWAAERKDVLCGLFCALTLWAYAGYARQPSAGRYALVAAALALALLAKPMAVTLPCVLLLLDYWPLGRLGPGAPPGAARRAVLEKLPLLALAAASAVATLAAQASEGTVEAVERVSPAMRVTNAAVSYVMYVVQAMYPVCLSVHYPHLRGGLPLWEVMGAVVLLVLGTVGAVLARRRHPYLLVGWLWYLGMLVPVIGLVQVGTQARADRYTYLPMIGLYVAVVWWVWDQTPARLSRPALAIGVAVVLALLAALSYRQAEYWRDSEAMYTRAIDCTGPNVMARTGLATYLLEQGRMREAVDQMRAAVAADPSDRPEDVQAHDRALAWFIHNYGAQLLGQGRPEEAVPVLREAVALGPPDREAARRTLAAAHAEAAHALAGRGRLDDAADHAQAALDLDPKLARAYSGLGVVLLKRGKTAEAAAYFRKALELDPADAVARDHLDTPGRQLPP